MVKDIVCPCCGNSGLKIDVPNGKKVVTTGKPLKEYNCITMCTVCKRRIKYDISNENE